MKTITQAHEDALSTARIECSYRSQVEKVVQIYLKSMMDDGYVIMKQEPIATARDLGILSEDGIDC